MITTAFLHPALWSQCLCPTLHGQRANSSHEEKLSHPVQGNQLFSWGLQVERDSQVEGRAPAWDTQAQKEKNEQVRWPCALRVPLLLQATSGPTGYNIPSFLLSLLCRGSEQSEFIQHRLGRLSALHQISGICRRSEFLSHLFMADPRLEKEKPRAMP